MAILHEKTPYEKINPFTGVWVRTRETVRYVIEEKPVSFALLVIVLVSIVNSIAGSLDPQFTDTFSIVSTVLIGFIVGPIFGLIGVSILSAVYLLIGKLFKGKGTYLDIFKAVAVGLIPSLWFAPLLLIGYFVAPSAFDLTSDAEISVLNLIVSALVSIAGFIVAIWTMVIQSKAIGEAHQFSSWKGFFTVLIPAVVGIVLLILLVIVVIAAFGAMLT
ncbi:YIP1 family protein [Planococcus sp. YIM B11945]|uniref:YIP1 family protein n=1 Tax=Planococcus sp. YIM B11945 TaxID=3435410 RepID=UPI003D7E7835